MTLTPAQRQTIHEATDEAIASLMKSRGLLILSARNFADSLINIYGRTNVRQVFEAMQENGHIPPNIPHHWLGAVFRSKKYKWDGTYAEGTTIPTTHRTQGLAVKNWTHA